MRITPLDIIQKEFTANRKGFDADEVRAFLEQVRESFEEVLKENRRYQEALADRDREIERLRSTDSDVRATLDLARKLSEELKGTARREADLVVGEARLEAQRIISSSHDEHVELVGEVHRLRGQRHRLEAEIRAVAETHLKMLQDGEREA